MIATAVQFQPMETPALPPTILVVEDEPLIAFDIEGALSGLGASVRLARSIGEARQGLINPPLPQLVLLDVILPDGHSFDLAREILAMGLPIAFLTGYDYGIPDELRDVTVVDKPFSAETLVGIVKGLIGEARSAGGSRLTPS